LKVYFEPQRHRGTEKNKTFVLSFSVPLCLCGSNSYAALDGARR
jgi:hypothetical protein